MRLKSIIWVKAYIRRCAVNGVPAMVVHHGDDDAGAIFIKVNRLDGTCLLFAPGASGLDGAESERQWQQVGPVAGSPEAEVDQRLSRERDFDRDVWVVEVEDRAGRHFLDDWLAPP